MSTMPTFKRATLYSSSTYQGRLPPVRRSRQEQHSSKRMDSDNTSQTQTANNSHRRGGRPSTGEYNQNDPGINAIMSPSNKSSAATAVVAATGTNGSGGDHVSTTPIPTPSASTTHDCSSRTPPRTPRTPQSITPTTSYSAPNATRGIRTSRSRASTSTETATHGIKRRMYLIRHGESKGQRASSRKVRQTDEKLIDCGLTRNGMEQAKFIPQLMALEGVDPIQLVVTSPLTRAIHTTLLAFPTKYHDNNTFDSKCYQETHGSNNKNNNDDDIGMYLDEEALFTPSGNDNADNSEHEDMEIDNSSSHETKDMEINSNLEEDIAPTFIPRTGVPILMAYDLREVGSMIPENRPRRFKDIWFDLNVDRITQDRFDLQSLLFQTEYNPVSLRSSPVVSVAVSRTTPLSSATPDFSSSFCWPRGHDTPPKVVRKDRVRQVFTWLATQLPTHITTFAVICHHNVIQTALSGASNPIIQNTPISPNNAQPIECTLHGDGQVELLRILPVRCE